MRELGQFHHNLGDLVTAEIRAAILSGRLKPGERLKQERLAADLSVSRIPVREALRVLEAEGLVESFPGRGSVVATITVKDAADVLEVRGVLEGLAARLAATVASQDAVSRLRSLVARGQTATASNDQVAVSEAHTAFHLELARASANSYLFEELHALPAKTEWIFSTLLKVRGQISWTEHEAIAEAVAAGDPDLADRLTREHIAKAIGSLDEVGAEP